MDFEELKKQTDFLSKKQPWNTLENIAPKPFILMGATLKELKEQIDILLNQDSVTGAEYLFFAIPGQEELMQIHSIGAPSVKLKDEKKKYKQGIILMVDSGEDN